MAYNYGQPPGAYGQRQPSFGYPPTPGAPGIGGAPGMDAPPGMTAQTPNSVQSHFQPPPSLPNINFNAPVIRLGVDQPHSKQSPMDRIVGGGRDRDGSGRGSNAEPLGRRDRLGLGADQGGGRNIERDRAVVRESMMALQPPTREEVARTIFVGGLGENSPDDETIENILRCAGKLRRWTRATDAEGKKCKFGFAEYEDVESLEAANEILGKSDVAIPLFKNGAVIRDDEGDVKKSRLLVVVDDQSKDYIFEWKGKRGEDDDARQFRIDGCKEDLRQCLTAIANRGLYTANGALNGEGATGSDADGDAAMTEVNGSVQQGDGAEVVTIPVTLEDELSDIPAEMRATVAEEIRAFRDRSNRRDLERLRREEELETQERQRNLANSRINRLASPPPGTPSGPSGSNGVPSAPRAASGVTGSSVPGAPVGPKGFRGVQMPSDYANGVAFVNGSVAGMNLHEDDDAEESDEELERRRKAKRDEQAERDFQDAERRWLNRERTRRQAQEREKARQTAEQEAENREKAEMARMLHNWNDDEEARRGVEEYYRDRSAWLRKRGAYRDREAKDDERDRQAERRELASSTANAKGMADDFMDKMGAEIAGREKASEQPAGFKLSLGSAAAKSKAAAEERKAAVPRKTMENVENLLEDEEDAALTGAKRPELKPLTDLSTAPLRTQDLTNEERDEMRRQLAQEIPTDATSLFAYPVKWSYLSSDILDEQIRPFVEKKVLEYLGVQEDLLVDAVQDALMEKKGAKDVVELLEEALEEEAEGLVKKVWRLVVFWTENEARGLGTT